MQVIKQNKRKLIQLLLGGIVMTLCGFGILQIAIGYMYSEPSYSTFIARNKEIAIVGAIVGIIFFGSATVLITYEIMNKSPLMTICNRGVVCHSGLTRNVRIAWEDVEGVYTMNINYNAFIAIKLKSVGLFLQKQNLVTRKIIRLSLSMGQPDITISVASTNESPVEVLAIMNKHWGEWKKNNEQKGSLDGGEA